ncbi:MAG: hypothetical protein IPK19_25260 [Chloroflexi bacterium]|nr:hypothetical protein [Chloroflexota bacterium]
MLFFGIVGIELILILFIAPAFTAGAITGERERQTYDLLQTTLLSKATFVIGKLESALGYIVLLPAQRHPAAKSGLSVWRHQRGGDRHVGAAAAGDGGAARHGRHLLFGGAAPDADRQRAGLWRGARRDVHCARGHLDRRQHPQRPALYPPGALPSPPMEALLRYIDLLLISINPAAAGITAQTLLVNQDVLAFYTYTLRSDGSTIPMVSPWLLFTVIYLSTSAVLIALTIRKANQDTEDL